MLKKDKYSYEGELPDEALTRCGQKYNPRDSVWRFNTNTAAQNLNFEAIELKITPRLLLNIKTVFMLRLRDYSVGHERNLLSSFSRAVEVGGSPLSEITLENIRFDCPANAKKIPVFLKKWYELGIDGVNERTYEQSKAFKAPKQDVGRVVRSHDPRKSTLTVEEAELLTNKLNQIYADGTISTEDYLIFALLLCTGARGAQIVSLRCSSFKGDTLELPKIKNNAPKYRDVSVHKLSPNLAIWGLLRAHVEGRLKEAGCGQEIAMFRYTTSGSISCRISRINKVHIGLNSDRLREGELMPVTPRRLRHTIATRMAEAGRGCFSIAETLTHEDVTSCQVYIDSTPTRDKMISDVMSVPLKAVGQAFMGEVIDDESQFPDPRDGSTKMDKRIEFGPKGSVGNCGKCGSCSARAPISCYTCPMFRPWRDAPHKDILEYLTKEREETIEITKDPEVSKATDLTIGAVLAVIQACDLKRKEVV